MPDANFLEVKKLDSQACNIYAMLAIFLIIWPLNRRFCFKSRARHAWKSRMMSPHSGRWKLVSRSARSQSWLCPFKYRSLRETWSSHIKELCRKISSAIGALRRIRSLISQSTAEQIYNALIQPYFDYCASVWDGLSSYLCQKLQKLQNRAARVIL